MPTDYERQRAERVAQNTKMLQDLMGRTNKENMSMVKKTVVRTAGHKRTPKKRATPTKKRVQLSSGDELEESRLTKRARPESPQLGLRRSARNAGKTLPNYQAESQIRLPHLVTAKVGVDHERDPNRRSGKRIHDPYVGCLLVVWQDTR
jgi:E3 ubiquitin-protein ligase UHRF1